MIPEEILARFPADGTWNEHASTYERPPWRVYRSSTQWFVTYARAEQVGTCFSVHLGLAKQTALARWPLGAEAEVAALGENIYQVENALTAARNKLVALEEAILLHAADAAEAKDGDPGL